MKNPVVRWIVVALLLAAAAYCFMQAHRLSQEARRERAGAASIIYAERPMKEFNPAPAQSRAPHRLPAPSRREQTNGLR